MNSLNLGYYIAPAIGLITLLIGSAAVLRPQIMSKNFGIAASGPALPYVVSTGIRDLFIGITILILFRQQDWNSLGLVHLSLGIVAISDFLVVQRHGDKKASLIHLAGAVAVIGYGIFLLV